MLRVGISGLGSFAAFIANSVAKSDKLRLVACYTRSPEKREAFAQRYGCSPASSYEAMMKRSDLDAVLLITPNAVHCEQAVIAAAHGKHVFVEKPIANTMEDGRAMAAACASAGVTLMVGHVNRRHAANRKTRELIDAGTIGDIVMVEANQSSADGWDLTPNDFRWYGDDTGSPAGPLMSMGIHQSDTLQYLLGPVTSVFSVFRRRHIPAPVDDVTSTLLEFESGVIGYLGSNYASPKTNWLRVYGTKGSIIRTVSSVDRRYDTDRSKPIHQNTRLELLRAGQAEPETVSLPSIDPTLEELNEFADCVRTRRQPETDGTGGLAALALIRAAIESAKTGQRVYTAEM